MIVRRLGQVVTAVALVTSGGYLMIYLYRWEWNRALVAGLFLVAAEVALSASSVLRRLQHLEERLSSNTPPPPAIDPATLVRVQEAAPTGASPFAWLEPTRMGVFVPVLLGAGVLLSVVAHLVERVAGATATPVLERRLARRLAPIARPTGGLLAPSAPLVPSPLAPPGPGSGGVAVVGAQLVAGIVVALLLVGAVDLLGDATQSRPDAPARDAATELTVAVRHRDPGRSTLRTVEGLWVACRNTASRRSTASAPVDLGGGQARFVITPHLGEHAQRRFVGCIEDATIERVQADVISLLSVPSEPVGP